MHREEYDALERSMSALDQSMSQIVTTAIDETLKEKRTKTNNNLLQYCLLLKERELPELEKD
jgi:hypothetical protein